jgi:hypothetical protein
MRTKCASSNLSELASFYSARPGQRGTRREANHTLQCGSRCPSWFASDRSGDRHGSARWKTSARSIDVSVAPRKCERGFPVVSPIGCNVLWDDGSSILGPKSLAVIPTLLARLCSLALVVASVPALAQPGREPNRATLPIPLSEEQVRTKATE